MRSPRFFAPAAPKTAATPPPIIAIDTAMYNHPFAPPVSCPNTVVRPHMTLPQTKPRTTPKNSDVQRDRGGRDGVSLILLIGGGVYRRRRREPESWAVLGLNQ